jgi:DNA-directed RNA polymerase specialized sigma24 family protein
VAFEQCTRVTKYLEDLILSHLTAKLAWAELPAQYFPDVMRGPETNAEVAKRGAHFNTTHWSVVLLAGQKSSPHSAKALEKLCRAYWFPVFAFAQRKGCGPEDAKDLTQEFFSRLLERNDFAGLDPQKGKFRTFLLTAFTHFLSNERDRAGALKRGGGKLILSLDGFSADQLGTLAAENCPPAKEFDLRWALAVLDQALNQLKTEMSAAGKTRQFDQLSPFLTTEAGEGDYAAAAHKLEVADSSVAVLVHRMRQHYRELVRAVVAQTVSSPAEIEEEMRNLFEVLNQ